MAAASIPLEVESFFLLWNFDVIKEFFQRSYSLSLFLSKFSSFFQSKDKFFKVTLLFEANETCLETSGHHKRDKTSRHFVFFFLLLRSMNDWENRNISQCDNSMEKNWVKVKSARFHIVTRGSSSFFASSWRRSRWETIHASRERSQRLMLAWRRLLFVLFRFHDASRVSTVCCTEHVQSLIAVSS